MGSLVKLMVNEKVVVALVRIRDKGESEQTTPIGFKIHKDKIPSTIRFEKFHSNNMYNLTVPGGKPLPVMIVCVGEDSQEIIPIYSAFCQRAIKERKIVSLNNKINHWIGVSGLTLVKIDKSVFKTVFLKEFYVFIKHAESISKCEKRCSNQKEIKNPEIVNLVDENSSHATKATPLSAEYGKTSFSGLQSAIKEYGSCGQDFVNLKNLINYTKDLAIKYRAAAKVLPSTHQMKSFFNETSQIQMNLLEIVENIERSISTIKQEFPVEGSTNDLRIISEEDQTKELGNVTLIEGLLPVKTTNYKKAISSLPSEFNDREPSHVIATIAKLCFPDHWVNGVTLKGSGGNKSLLDLWNYENPLKVPVSGKINRQLGLDRYQALVDHTMRKCGKKSYHSETEKHLTTVLSKAIHYKRTKINQPKGWEDISDSSSDENLDWSPFESGKDKLDQTDIDTDDDEIIPATRSRASRNRITESFSEKSKDMDSDAPGPVVSLKVVSPIPYSERSEKKNEPRELETDAEQDDPCKMAGKVAEKIGNLDARLSKSFENKDRAKKEDKSEKDQNTDAEEDTIANKQDSQDSDMFEFDDDDELLGEIDYLKNSPSPPSLFGDDERKGSSRDDKANEKPIAGSSKVVQPVFSSTPVSKKIAQTTTAFSSITPIRSTTKNLKDLGVSETVTSESGIEMSADEKSLAEKPSDASILPSANENKRKSSDSSLTDVKKIKNRENDLDESNTSTLSAGSTAIKFMDPQTLAFINDPANVGFLQQLIASRAAQTTKKN